MRPGSTSVNTLSEVVKAERAYDGPKIITLILRENVALTLSEFEPRSNLQSGFPKVDI